MLSIATQLMLQKKAQGFFMPLVLARAIVGHFLGGAFQTSRLRGFLAATGIDGPESSQGLANWYRQACIIVVRGEVCVCV